MSKIYDRKHGGKIVVRAMEDYLTSPVLKKHRNKKASDEDVRDAFRKTKGFDADKAKLFINGKDITPYLTGWSRKQKGKPSGRPSPKAKYIAVFLAVESHLWKHGKETAAYRYAAKRIGYSETGISNKGGIREIYLKQSESLDGMFCPDESGKGAALFDNGYSVTENGNRMTVKGSAWVWAEGLKKAVYKNTVTFTAEPDKEARKTILSNAK